MKRSVRGVAALLGISFSMLGGSVAAQEKTALVTERDKVSYAIGVDVGNSLQPVGPFMDTAAFERAIVNTFAGKPALISEQEAQATDQLLRVNLAVADGQPIPGMPPGSTNRSKSCPMASTGVSAETVRPRAPVSVTPPTPAT